MILHTPARREDHKVSNRHTWFGAWASQDSVDEGVLSGGTGGRGFIGAAIDGGVLGREGRGWKQPLHCEGKKVIPRMSTCLHLLAHEKVRP